MTQAIIPMSLPGSDQIAVVIPCFKVKGQISEVVQGIPDFVRFIILVNDCCPEDSLKEYQHSLSDRITVVDLPENRGVGGATMAGYQKALELGAKVVVKMDGDGQMDSAHLHRFVIPLLERKADYTKGNRFYEFYFLRQMPAIRIFGNSVLSFFAKLSSGYWFIMDPNNGYTAISSVALSRLPMNRIANRYFFESDLLVHLSLIRAVVKEVPIPAHYGNETSNLSITNTVMTFPLRHFQRFFTRVFYNYFLRNFNYGSLCLVVGVLLSAFGTTFGLYHWILSVTSGQLATSGTVMLSAMPILVGLNLLLSFCNYDIENQPKEPLLSYD